jgi:hypothetical protein
VSSSFTSSRVAGRVVAGTLLWCMTALAFSGAACVSAHIIATGTGGSDGQGGAGLRGTGGSDTGAAGGDTGAGGSGTGGMATGGIGAGGMATGGSGMGGSAGAGTGGAIVDAGAGGMIVDAGYDGPTGITPYAAGQLVITEIMADSNDVPDDSGEWFELYNPSTTVAYDLFGCDLSDSGNHNAVAAHIIVAPMESVTMARFATTAGGFPPTYDYHTTLKTDGSGMLEPTADVKFSNTGDSVHVACGITTIDAVDFHLWVGSNAMVPNGRSYSLDVNHYSATANDVEGNWCVGTNVYHSTDRGTPGQLNPPCSCMDGAVDGGCVFM